MAYLVDEENQLMGKIYTSIEDKTEDLYAEVKKIGEQKELCTEQYLHELKDTDNKEDREET